MLLTMLPTGYFRRYWKRIAIPACLVLVFLNLCLVLRETEEIVRQLSATKPSRLPGGGLSNTTNEDCCRRNTKPRLNSQILSAKPQPGPGSPCRPGHRFVFIKIHKAGSSTVTTMLERYGYRRDLNFALPRTGLHFFPKDKDFQASLVFQWDLRDTSGALVWPTLGGFQVLANHARYDRNVQDAVVPNAVHFTIIREPVSRFESFFGYFLLDRQVPHNSSANPLEVFLTDPQKYNSAIQNVWLKFFRNGQIYMLGMEPDAYDDPEAVDAKIESLSRDMDLVMITEYFDESLVLLKKLLCWSFEDIVHVSKAIRKPGSTRNITADMRNKIRQWTLADVKLYQHFNRTFWEKVRSYGPDFQRDLETFRKLRMAVMQKCLGNGRLHWDWHRSSYWRLPQNASEKCQDLVRQDNAWTGIIRNRMVEKSGAFINYRKG